MPEIGRFLDDDERFPKPPNRDQGRAAGKPLSLDGKFHLELGPKSGSDLSPGRRPPMHVRRRAQTLNGVLYGPTSPVVKMSPRCEFFQISNDYGVRVDRAPKDSPGSRPEEDLLEQEQEDTTSPRTSPDLRSDDEGDVSVSTAGLMPSPSPVKTSGSPLSKEPSSPDSLSPPSGLSASPVR